CAGWDGGGLPGGVVLGTAAADTVEHELALGDDQDRGAGKAAPAGLPTGGDRVHAHREVGAALDRDGRVVGGLHPAVLGELDVPGGRRGESGGHGENGGEDDDGGDE